MLYNIDHLSLKTCVQHSSQDMVITT